MSEDRAAEPNEQPLLEISDLAVSFDNGRGPRLQAVDGVSLSIYPDQTLALVGESGCGKSVTAMSILRLIPTPPARYDSGRIDFNTPAGRRDLLSMSPRSLRQVRGDQAAMIFQEPMTSLNPVFTIGEQIIEAIRLHRPVRRREATEIAEKALVEVGIREPGERLGAYPHEFSGGMRQRVMIAMALACEPALLLADEPTTALDVTIQAQILDLLRDLQRKRRMSVMLITHDLGVVAENADVVCVMYAGRVVEYGAVEEIFRNPLHPYTHGLFASIPTMHGQAERLRTISEIVSDPARFEVLRGIGVEHRPWWPWHDSPPEAARSSGPGADSILLEVRPDHWVSVWRTEEAAQLSPRKPRLAYRKARAGREASTSA